MNWIPSICAAVVFMLCLGVVLASILAVASRKFVVHEDPRIDEVENMLPHVNCGACGYPGCRPFAEAVVKGDATPAECTVNTAECNQRIADYLGVDMEVHSPLVARLACAGGNHVAKMRAHYAGLGTCRAAAVAGGGGKACCLGLPGVGRLRSGL